MKNRLRAAIFSGSVTVDSNIATECRSGQSADLVSFLEQNLKKPLVTIVTTDLSFLDVGTVRRVCYCCFTDYVKIPERFLKWRKTVWGFGVYPLARPLAFTVRKWQVVWIYVVGNVEVKFEVSDAWSVFSVILSPINNPQEVGFFGKKN